jgi:hypothetical protein
MKTNTLKGISDKMRKYEDYNPPQPRNSDLPPCYNICLSASPKGGGKTYNCILLLQAYEKSGFVATDGTEVRMRTIWVAGGTSRSKQNNILNTLDTLHDDDRIDMETDIDKKLTELYDKLLKERDEVEAYMVYIKTYKKFMKKTSSLNYEELLLLQFKKYIDPKDDADRPIDSDGNILENPRVCFLVLDDMISGDAFSSTKRSNFLNRLSVKSRHESDKLVGINLFFITQSFKSIPAIIRRQTDIFILLKSASQSYIIDAISEEIGSTFSKQELEELYVEIMKIPYGSLILSLHKKEKEENRARVGWSKSIVRNSKYII